MSTNSPRKEDLQELDLSAVSKGVGSALRNLNTFLYRCIRFVLRNIILLGILVIVGGGIGTWLDHTQKRVYSHHIIVTPNFGSTDYLYSKIELIDAKIKEGDTVFLKGIGIQRPKDLMEIKIAPIIDVFKFVNNNNNEQNYRLLELMAQDGDIKKIVAENTTSKNYPFHTISFVTRGKTTKEKTVAPLLAYLNDNDYYRKVQKEYLNNVMVKLKANDLIISQIDAVLNDFADSQNGSPKNDKLVYYNENTQLNDVIKTKDELIKEQGLHRVDLVGLDKIIKDNSIITNIKDSESLSGKMKLVLPLLLVGLFLLVFFFRAFYRKQTIKYNSNH